MGKLQQLGGSSLVHLASPEHDREMAAEIENAPARLRAAALEAVAEGARGNLLEDEK